MLQDQYASAMLVTPASIAAKLSLAPITAPMLELPLREFVSHLRKMPCFMAAVAWMVGGD